MKCLKHIKISRKLKVALLVFILLSLTHSGVANVEADPGIYSYITITFTSLAASSMPPTEFHLTVINDHNIKIDWIPNIAANGTYIVGKQGSYPMSSTDGVVIYSGSGNTTNDISVSLDELAANMYYYAYSIQSDGSIPLDHIANNIGGESVTLLGLAILFIIAISLVVLSTILMNSLWDWLGALFFILSAWWAYTHSLANNDFYYIAFFIACFLIIISVFMAMYIAYEDRKSKRVYTGGMIGDNEIEKGMVANNELITFHRNNMKSKVKARHTNTLFSLRKH